MFSVPKVSIDEYEKMEVKSTKSSNFYKFDFVGADSKIIKKPVMLIKGSKVKYAGRFDNITIILSDTEIERMGIFENSIKKTLGENQHKFNFSKDGEMKIKVKKENVKLTKDVSELKAGDSVDVIFMFNDCCEMGAKIYTSYIMTNVANKGPMLDEIVKLDYSDLFNEY